MNKYTAAAYLPFVQALIDGKTIERRTNRPSGWTPQACPDFILPPEDYRIKPEPRCVFINEYGIDCTGEVQDTIYLDKDSAVRFADKRRAKRIAVKYIEAEDQT